MFKINIRYVRQTLGFRQIHKAKVREWVNSSTGNEEVGQTIHRKPNHQKQ